MQHHQRKPLSFKFLTAFFAVAAMGCFGLLSASAKTQDFGSVDFSRVSDVVSDTDGQNQTSEGTDSSFYNGSYTRAVTYAGSGWVINFWSTEMAGIDEDLEQIRADGFNTIIVCVPWREFQPYTAKIGYSEQALVKLRHVMDRADAHGLKVILRLGYTWDYGGDDNVLERYQGLLSSDVYRYAWKEYARKIYQNVCGYSSYGGAFLTWEDFWNFVETEKNIAGTGTGKTLAKESGYTAYALKHYKASELQALYGDAQNAASPAFPSAESPAYRIFLEWYDSWLAELLKDTQEVFPDLSMECRLDQDPYVTEDGETAHYDHAATFACGDASYSSVMLSASMGFDDDTTQTAAETAAMSAQLLDRAALAAGKPVFVDQFLYRETTPGYEHLAGVRAGEMNDYLSLMGDVFAQKTNGYGIWTYRDYADSIIYNPEFGLELDGWNKYGSVSVEKKDGTKMAKLAKGAMLSQELSNRNYLSEKDTILRFRAVSAAPATLTVTVGGITKKVTVNGDDITELDFPQQVSGSVRFSANGEVWLDDILLYTHVTEGGIYDLEGKEGAYLAGIRSLNQKLGGTGS